MDIIVVPAETVEVWQRMPAESTKAYAAFLAYQRLHPRDRSLRRAVEQHYGNYSSSKVRQFQKWSSRFMWVDRANAWDDHVAEVSRQEQVEKIKKMNELHVQAAKGLMQKAIQRLATMDSLELAPNDVLRYISESVRMERIAMGEPDTITEDRSSTDDIGIHLVEMSDEELRQQIIAIRMSKKK